MKKNRIMLSTPILVSFALLALIFVMAGQVIKSASLSEGQKVMESESKVSLLFGIITIVFVVVIFFVVLKASAYFIHAMKDSERKEQDKYIKKTIKKALKNKKRKHNE